MAIDACAFVKPAFFHGYIGTYSDNVFSAIVQVFRNIVLKTIVPAWLGTQVMAVNPNYAITVNTVKSDSDMPPQVGGRNTKFFTVPAYARLREVTPDGFVAVSPAAFRAERLLNGPIVRQVYFAPAPVVKIGRSSAIAITCLSKIRE